MITLFIKFEFQKIIKYFKTKTLAKVITSALFALVLMFVGSLIYLFFLSGFRYISVEATEDIKLALTLFIYEVFLLVLSGIIVFSAMVTGVFSLFRGGYNNWIISTPGYKFFPSVILIRSLLTSSLPSLIMFVPAVLAFNRVYDIGFVSLVFILDSVLILLLTLNTITLLFVLFVGTLYQKLSKKIKFLQFSFKNFIILLVLITAGVVTFIWKSIKNVDLVKLFRAEDVDTAISITTISNNFYLLPTHPFAMQIVKWENGNTGGALYYFGILVILLVLVLIIWKKVSHLYYPLWKQFQDGVSTVDTASNTTKKVSRAYHFTGGTTMALFKKEALISSRNLKGMLWLIFLSLIWLAQIATNVILSKNIGRYQPDVTEKLALMQTIQFIIAIYFIASFTLRFAFPSFSVEKKTGWILASAPLSFKKIFFSKYLFYTSFFVGLGTLMSYINSTVLGLSTVSALYILGLFVVIIVFIVTLGLCLGALFPNTETDDPEVISTSMPGLFFTALALIYGALGTLVLYLSLTKGNTLILIVSYIIVTVVLAGILLLKVSTMKRYKTFE